MRALAAWAMKGPREATSLAAVAAAIPPIESLFLLSMIMGGLSSAIVSLVVLRQGFMQATAIVSVALAIAALGCVYSQHPVVLLPMLLSLLMATLLRSRPLVQCLIAAVPIAVLLVLMVNQVIPLWTDEHQQTLLKVFEAWSKDAQMPLELDKIAPFLKQLALGVWVAGMLFVAYCALFLARHWQAMLFNPGGFQQEFHALVLPRSLSIATIVLMLGLELLGPAFGLVLPSLYLLSMLAGVALVHGLIGRPTAKSQPTGSASGNDGKSLALLWLFYISMVLLQPMLLLLISMAWMDSFAQFRQRFKTKS